MTSTPASPRVLLHDTVSLVVAGFVVAILSGIGWLALSGSSSQPSTTKKPTHMHCPACLDEIVYNPKMVGKKCTNCSEGGIYKATVGSIFDENRDEDGNGGRIVLFILAVVVGIQSLVFAGRWRLKVLRQRAENALNRMVLARCPFCKRKVAYPIVKAGTWTTCYQCKTAFALPASEVVA